VLAARNGRDYWRGLGDLRLLRRYERARQADVAAMAGFTDQLQRLFAQKDGPWPALRNGAMRAVSRSGPVKHWLARQAMGLA
jgi:2-polyprenyl-6-methoxyphenol hydroxylase-like FAD-dependent oxidoreductase